MKMRWEQRLVRAAERGIFTNSDRLAAKDWGSCAVGEHRGEYETRGEPGWFKNAPRNKTLERLGCDFYSRVMGDEVSAARQFYTRINRWLARYGAKQ